MNRDEAVVAVRAYMGDAAEGPEFSASFEEGDPGLWYVTHHAEGRDIVGGDAYVVVDNDAQVFEVSAGVPPELNVRDVRRKLELEKFVSDGAEKPKGLSEIEFTLSDSVTGKGIEEWLRASNRLLGGKQPLEALRDGQQDLVMEAAKAFIDGSYT